MYIPANIAFSGLSIKQILVQLIQSQRVMEQSIDKTVKGRQGQVATSFLQRLNNYRVIMRKVTLREIRILFDEVAQTSRLLALKICANQQILRFKNLKWNSVCSRWQSEEDICLFVNPHRPIEIEIYDPKAGNLDCVLGETVIDIGSLHSPITHQIRLCLTFDGLVVGWIYCQLLTGIPQCNQISQYIYIHKIAVSFLEKEEECSLTVLLNTFQIYHKTFKLNNRAKTLYPNIKNGVKKSDLLTFRVQSKKFQSTPISLLVDHIKCGETTFFNLWLRNNYKKKYGELNIQYFLDNIYLENDCRTFTRKYCQIPFLKEVSTPQESLSRESFNSIKEFNMDKECFKRTKHLKKTILACSHFKKNSETFKKKEEEKENNNYKCQIDE